MGGIASIDEEEENGFAEMEPLSLYRVLSVEKVPTGPSPNPEPKSNPNRCCSAATEGVITVTGDIDDCLLGAEILVVRKSGIETDGVGCVLGNLGNAFGCELRCVTTFWSTLIVCVSSLLSRFSTALFLPRCTCSGICVNPIVATTCREKSLLNGWFHVLPNPNPNGALTRQSLAAPCGPWTLLLGFSGYKPSTTSSIVLNPDDETWPGVVLQLTTIDIRSTI